MLVLELRSEIQLGWAVCQLEAVAIHIQVLGLGVVQDRTEI